MTHTDISPAARVGDVVNVSAGACREYRASFRMRVTEIITCSERGALNYPIMGGTVVNADGRDRLVKGTPVERGITLWRGVTVIVPAPATEDEIREAYAEHAVREIERTRCDHTSDVIGCTHVHCQGVPPVAGATVAEPMAAEVATGGECGTQTVARSLRDALRVQMRTAVDMPTVSVDGGRPGIRRFLVASALVGQHSVHMIMWEGSGYASMTALLVDGALVDADVTGGRAMTTAERSNLVARKVSDVISDVAPTAVYVPVPTVDPMAVSVSAVTPVLPAAEVPATSRKDSIMTVTATPVVPAAESLAGDILATVDRMSLETALIYVARTQTVKSLPILSFALFSVSGDLVTVATGNYDVTRTVELDTLGSEAPHSGVAALPTMRIRDWVKALPKSVRSVTVSASGVTATLTAGALTLTVDTAPVEDLRPVMLPAPSIVGTLKTDALATLAGRGKVSAGVEETEPMLTGIRVVTAGDQVTVTSTDRYRLTESVGAFTPYDSDQADTARVIPAKPFADSAATFARRAGARTPTDVSYLVGDAYGNVGFECDGYRIVMRALDGSYPPVASLFPATVNGTLTVAPAALVGAVKSATSGAGTDDKTCPVIIAVAGDAVTAQFGYVPETQRPAGIAPIVGTITGDLPDVAGFNPSYLLDLVASFGKADTVTLGFVDGVKPMVATSDQAPGYRHLIMPIRVTRGTAPAVKPVKAGTVTDVHAFAPASIGDKRCALVGCERGKTARVHKVAAESPAVTVEAPATVPAGEVVTVPAVEVPASVDQVPAAGEIAAEVATVDQAPTVPAGVPTAEVAAEVPIGPESFRPYVTEIRGCGCPLCTALAGAVRDGAGIEPTARVLLAALATGTHVRTVAAPAVAAPAVAAEAQASVPAVDQGDTVPAAEAPAACPYTLPAHLVATLDALAGAGKDAGFRPRVTYVPAGSATDRQGKPTTTDSVELMLRTAERYDKSRQFAHNVLMWCSWTDVVSTQTGACLHTIDQVRAYLVAYGNRLAGEQYGMHGDALDSVYRAATGRPLYGKQLPRQTFTAAPVDQDDTDTVPPAEAPAEAPATPVRLVVPDALAAPVPAAEVAAEAPASAPAGDMHGAHVQRVHVSGRGEVDGYRFHLVAGSQTRAIGKDVRSTLGAARTALGASFTVTAPAKSRMINVVAADGHTVPDWSAVLATVARVIGGALAGDECAACDRTAALAGAE